MGTLDPEIVSPKTAATADWTWMVYLDADCNLEGAGIQDINEMETVGSTSAVNIIVQIDRISGYDSSNGDWTSCRRYKVTRDTNVYTIGSTLVQSLGEVNMGDPATLSSFIDWGKTNYPANHYALVLWDHGSGSMYGPSVGGVCWDDTTGDDYLTLTEIRGVLNTRPIDLLAYDACLMGGIETYYENRGSVTVGVGSEETEPGAGYPYDTILQWLTTNPSATAEQLGQTIVTKYMYYYNTYGSEEVTQGSARSANMPSLTTAVDILARDLIICPTDYKSQVYTARANSQAFAGPEFIDLYDFCTKLKALVANTTIQSDATAVQNAITAALVAEGHTSGYPGAHGISIYFATTGSEYSPDYETLQFAVNCRWDELIKWVYGIGGGGGTDDIFEDDDTRSSAVPISAGYWQNLVSNTGDEDWYNISLQAGATIVVDIYFLHSGGNLNLYLYRFNSGSFVDSSSSTDDNESITYFVTMTGLYSILVFPLGTVPYNGYSMWILAPYWDDGYETNDMPSEANDITASVNSGPILNLVGNDFDFYNFTTTAGYLLNITLEHASNDGDCDLYLYDDTMTLLASSTTASTENIIIGADYSGEYMIFVSPQTTPIGHTIPYTSSYSLTIEANDLDDIYEDNDWFDQATPVSSGQIDNLVALDQDFFNATLYAGYWVSATILFSHAQGDLDLYLYDTESNWVSWSPSYSDNEMIIYYVPVTGIYTFIVDNWEDNLNYSFKLSNASLPDDALEENDYYDVASTIVLGQTYSNLYCWDWDCYNVTVPASTTFVSLITFSDSLGDLDLYVYNGTGDYVGGSYQAGANTELVILTTGSIGDTFTILVYNYEENPSYTLRTFINTLPIANFTANHVSGKSPLTVTFSDLSATGEGIANWAWDFGDGNVASVQNPTNTFTGVHTFQVTLTVKDLSGDESSYSLSIAVSAPVYEYPSLDLGWLIWILVPAASVLIVYGIVKNRRGGRFRV